MEEKTPKMSEKQNISKVPEAGGNEPWTHNYIKKQTFVTVTLVLLVIAAVAAHSLGVVRLPVGIWCLVVGFVWGLVVFGVAICIAVSRRRKLLELKAQDPEKYEQERQKIKQAREKFEQDSEKEKGKPIFGSFLADAIICGILAVVSFIFAVIKLVTSGVLPALVSLCVSFFMASHAWKSIDRYGKMKGRP